MTIILQFSFLALLFGLIMAAVRFLIVPGIDKASVALNLDYKVRGQLLGYATSTPELVIVVSSAASGVFDVGFWNIASSNIINWILFLSAVVSFRQFRGLRRKAFIDEFSFGLFSVLLPLLLHMFEAKGSVWLGMALLLVFLGYKALDKKLNRRSGMPTKKEEESRRIFYAIASMAAGVLLILVAGYYLGNIAEDLVIEVGIPSWLIGWILGFVSSVPEMSGFFEIYRKHKKAGTIDSSDDTQEALDSLIASNMCNLGIVLPVGVFVATLI